jgi:uncharacterized phiE125 gp8 family phage protein
MYFPAAGQRLWTTSIRKTVEPVAEPLTIAALREHLRVDLSDDDDLIEAILVAARSWVEQHTNRQFVPATFEWRLPYFPDRDDVPLRLPRAPALSIESITYIDTDGAEQTWSSSKYQTSLYRDPALLMPLPDEVWPNTQTDRLDAVTITFKAGYESGTSPEDGTGVPGPLVQAIKLIAGALYENREDFIVGTIVSPIPVSARFIASPYRLHWF